MRALCRISLDEEPRQWIEVYQMVTEDVNRLLRKGSLDATMAELETEFYKRAIMDVPEIDDFAHSRLHL